MNRLLLFYIGLFVSTMCYSQAGTELSIGPNINLAYKYQNRFTLKDYVSAKLGANIGVQKKVNLWDREIKLGVNLVYYQGEFNNAHRGWASTGYVEGVYDNLGVSLEIYPIAIKRNNFEFSLGLSFGYRAFSKTVLIIPKDQFLFPLGEGAIYNPDFEHTYDKSILYNKDKFGNRLSVGLQYELLYVVQLKNVELLPKLIIYNGLISDYRVFGDGVFRSFISPQISIRKSI